MAMLLRSAEFLSMHFYPHRAARYAIKIALFIALTHPRTRRLA